LLNIKKAKLRFENLRKDIEVVHRVILAEKGKMLYDLTTRG
jgi:hypothetical protein